MSGFSQTTTPQDIQCKEQVFDIDFHPFQNIIATGLIDGEVNIYRYGCDNGNVLIAKSLHHTSSCRGVLFNSAGDQLYTISSDKSLVTLDATGKIICTIS